MASRPRRRPGAGRCAAAPSAAHRRRPPRSRRRRSCRIAATATASVPRRRSWPPSPAAMPAAAQGRQDWQPPGSARALHRRRCAGRRQSRKRWHPAGYRPGSGRQWWSRCPRPRSGAGGLR
ncbi:hypothetical protein G6F24_017833 [Rhizopus arrhizus]|nr:hypothetical protein G6F24_017833 [Rhizopus arrhizus]